jgi:hypothetical protein
MDCIKAALGLVERSCMLFDIVDMSQLGICKLVYCIEFYMYFLGTILYPKLQNQNTDDGIIESSFLLIELLLVLGENKLNSRLLSTLSLCLDCIASVDSSTSDTHAALDITSLVEACLIEKILVLRSDRNSRLSTLKDLFQTLCRIPVGSFNTSDRILSACVKLLSDCESVDEMIMPLDCIGVHLEYASTSVKMKVCRGFLTFKIVNEVMAMMSNPSPPILSRILTILNQILISLDAGQENSKLGSIQESLKSLLANPSWDVKDIILDFINSLFSSPLSTIFALQSNLPLLLFPILEKEEHPFVRASTIRAITTIATTQSGWIYLLENVYLTGGVTLLARTMKHVLEMSIEDEDALVRRSCIESLRCVFEFHEGDAALYDDRLRELWKGCVRQASKDVDWEVRKCLVELLAVMLMYRKGENNLYTIVDGTRELLKRVKDESRSVREQVYLSLRKYVANENGKRERGVEGCEELLGIDFNELREKSVAEGLWDEALGFEVDSSLVRCDGQDENNCLACYDC